MLKKLTTFLLIIACVCSFSITSLFVKDNEIPRAHGEESDQTTGTEHTVTSNVNEIFELDSKEPEDYNKDSASPEGKEVNDEFLSIVENELILTTSNKGSSSATVRVIDEMTVADEKPASTNFNLGDTYGMSYADAVSLNALGNDSGNRDDHTAYIGIHGNNLRLVVLNLRTQQVVSTRDLGKATWLSGSSLPQFNYKQFIDITAGDFDNDKTDEIAVTVLSDSENSIYVFDDYTLNSYKIFAITDLVNKNAVNISSFIKVNSNKVHRPIVSLATGDLDCDDVVELAVSISTSNHSVPSNVSKETITTNVALIDQPLSNKTIYTLPIVGKTDVQNNITKNKLLYSSQMASGDVDGDGIEELVLAGYVGDVKKTSSSLENKYSISTSNIGLVTVSFETDKLLHSEISTQSMNAFIKEGFYNSDDVWTPLAIETARINGPKSAEIVFVSGTLYDFSGAMPIEKHVFNLFRSKPAKGSNAYVEKVVVGNFNNDAIGRESFAFTICYKYIGQHKYSYQLGYINGTYDDNSELDEFGENIKYGENGNAIKGHYWINEKGGYVDTSTSKYGTNFILTSADCDDDGVQLKYTGTGYAYSDPEVKAILQAAPYFSELGDAGDFSNGTSYTINTSYGKANSKEHSIGGEASVFLETEVGVLITKAKNQFAIASGGSITFGSEKEYSKSYSDTFTAGAYNTVILCRTPIKEFHYEVLNSKEEGTEHYVTTVPLKPVYYQLSIDDFNTFVDTYNAKLKEYNAKGYKNQATAFLQKIDNSILPSDTYGKPQNYYHSLPSDGQLLSTSTYAFGHNDGSTSVEYEDSYTHTTSTAHNFHIGASAQISAEAGVIFAKAEAGASISIEYSRDRSSSSSVSNAITMGGEVGNVSADDTDLSDPETIKNFNFNWQFAKWERQLYSNGKLVPVIGYIVKDVTKAGPSPENVNAEFNYETNDVDLSWEKSTEESEDLLTSFVIYRQATNGSLEQIGEVDSDTTTFSECYSNLTLRANYTYYISAKYLKFGTSSEYYECRSSSSAVIVGGISISTEQKWTAITSFDQITADGYYYVTDLIEMYTPVTITHDVVIDLNGQFIIHQTTEPFITVQSGATLELYDISDEGIMTDLFIAANEVTSPSIVNYGNLIISGGNYVATKHLICNYGNLTINEGNFYTCNSYIIKNLEGGRLTINNGQFEGYGSNNSFGIYHEGAYFNITGGEFSYLHSGIDVKEGYYITLNSIYVPTRSILVRVLNEEGESVGGEFTNEVGNLAEFLYNTFVSIDFESDVCLSENQKIMICYHSFTISEVYTEATCEYEGYIMHTCEHCGSFTVEVIPALGHNYGEWIPEKPATTEDYGVVAHYHCSNCDHYFNEDYQEIDFLYIGKTGETGEKGDAGNGIVSIEKISSEGLVDTYMITFEDGTFTTFTVTNGETGEKGEKGDSGCTASIIPSSSNDILSSGLIEIFAIAGIGLAILIIKRKKSQK